MAIVLIGPRQVGKTTLIESILESKDYLLLDGNDPKTRTLLTEPNTEQIRRIIGNYKYVFIDEAQRIEGFGLTMKIVTDRFKKRSIVCKWQSRHHSISYQNVRACHFERFEKYIT